MNGAQAPFIKLFICLHGIDFRDGNSMTRPRKRNRSRLSLSDSIEMFRLREFAKRKTETSRRRLCKSQEKKNVILIMVTKGDPSSCGDMKRVNEKGSVMSVTLATPTMRAYG